MFRKTALGCWALGVFWTAIATAADAPKKIDEKYHGTWTATSMEHDGMAAKPDAKNPFKLVISADKVVVHFDGKNSDADFAFDGSKKPAAFDLKTPLDTKTSVGIVEVDGDTMRFCFSVAEKAERPTEFTAKAGSERVMATFKREKK